MKKLLGWLIAACLLAACGDPDHGPELGAFEPIAKKETDEPFDLKAPSSKSPGAFTFTSSNTSVATIEGAKVTIKGVGESTITASQPRTGSYGPTSKSAILTVTAVACESGKTRVGGKCETIPTCTSPATLNTVSNKCIAPLSSAASVRSGGLDWMGVTHSDTWTNASAFCSGSVIENQSGWRLPTLAELSALYASKNFAGKSWMLENIWTSDQDSNAATAAHVTVHLGTGVTSFRANTAYAYVSCVR
jgi:hypothetical protein